MPASSGTHEFELHEEEDRKLGCDILSFNSVSSAFSHSAIRL